MACLLYTSRKQEELKGLSLSVYEGEILAIAGVDGNGQTQLAEAIVGLLKPQTGSIALFDRDVTGSSVRQRQDEGLAYIPQDRHKAVSYTHLDVYKRQACTIS